MPKTKLEELVYGLLMTLFMVLAMELYNTGLRMGGLTNAGILAALPETLIIFPICFVMGFCFVDRFAPRIAFRLVDPAVDRPIFVILARASITVAFMCPIMSFWATVIFKQPGWEFIPCWLQTVACNFPMAFFWQIFFCGPLVRFLFRLLFRRGKTSSAAQIQPIRFLPIKMPRACRFPAHAGHFSFIRETVSAAPSP